MHTEFRIGFVVNPVAGIGGPLAEKGSDHLDPGFRSEHILNSGRYASQRASFFLEQLERLLSEMRCERSVKFVVAPGVMGADLIANCFNQSSGRITSEIVSYSLPTLTQAVHTREVVALIQACKVDVLVFVGGDGTARDVCESIHPSQVCLGVPSGVKMQSAVFGVHPSASAEVIANLACGSWQNLALREVRDLDEVAYKSGKVVSRFYGEMKVPDYQQYVQQLKQGGVENEALLLLDLAEDIRERMQDLDGQATVIFGPGSTTKAIADELGLHGTTLLGVDIVRNDRVIAKDADRACIEASIEDAASTYLLLSVIGGQGHIVGRGNQQLSASLLRRIGRSHLWLLASKSKLNTLQNRPLLLDTGDANLDREWSGSIPVISGYRQETLYHLGWQRD